MRNLEINLGKIDIFHGIKCPIHEYGHMPHLFKSLIYVKVCVVFLYHFSLDSPLGN